MIPGGFAAAGCSAALLKVKMQHCNPSDCEEKNSTTIIHKAFGAVAVHIEFEQTGYVA